MSLVFVRHGESIGNVTTQDGRAGMDIPNHAYPLTERGVKQAQITGQFLAQEFASPVRYFSSVFTSDFLRAYQTTDQILLALRSVGPTPQKCLVDSRLNEKWDGIFHDLSKQEIIERYPDQIRLRKRTGYWLYRAPGGENCPDVELRIRSFVHDYWDDMIQRQTLAVGHGRWFLIFQKVIHGWSVAEFLQQKEKEDCANCMVAIYSSEDLEKKRAPKCCVPWEGQLTPTHTEFA